MWGYPNNSQLSILEKVLENFSLSDYPLVHFLKANGDNGSNIEIYRAVSSKDKNKIVFTSNLFKNKSSDKQPDGYIIDLQVVER